MLLLYLFLVVLQAAQPTITVLAETAEKQQCPGTCSLHGTCNPESGRCDCPLLRLGPDCSFHTSDADAQCKAFSHTPASCHSKQLLLCLNGCNHPNGWCEAGFCVCRQGYYGADCSLTLVNGRPALLPEQGYVERRRGVKVYVYELPPAANTWVHIARVDKPLLAALWQRLSASGARTADGDSADYYLLPFLLLASRAHDAGTFGAALRYVRAHWPWWERNHGHRHLIVAPGPQGRLDLPAELQALTANCTFLTHWGLHKDHAQAGWRAAHRHGQDIVLPPVLPPDEPIVFTPYHANNTQQRALRRERTLFFSGRICRGPHAHEEPQHGRCGAAADGHAAAAGGAAADAAASLRQQVLAHHWNRSGYTLWHHTQRGTQRGGLARGMASHIFCLAPAGPGYVRRGVQAVLMGCVPLLLADGVHQPFEPELDWGAFGVKLAERDAPSLHAALDRVQDASLLDWQERLPCAAQHLYWSSSLGSLMGEDGRYDAFETLMEVLRVRRERPGLAPGRYAQVDRQFADFLACRSEGTTTAPVFFGGAFVQRPTPAPGAASATAGAPAQTNATAPLPPPPPPPLCSQNRHVRMGRCRECYPDVPMRLPHAFYGWPGGAACCRETRVARCWRAWE